MFRSLIQKIKGNKFKCSLIFVLFLSAIYILISGSFKSIYFSLMVFYSSLVFGILSYLILSFPFIDFKNDFLKNKKLYIILSIVGGLIYCILSLIISFYVSIKAFGGVKVNPFLLLPLSFFFFIPFTLGFLVVLPFDSLDSNLELSVFIISFFIPKDRFFWLN